MQTTTAPHASTVRPNYYQTYMGSMGLQIPEVNGDFVLSCELCARNENHQLHELTSSCMSQTSATEEGKIWVTATWPTEHPGVLSLKPDNLECTLCLEGIHEETPPCHVAMLCDGKISIPTENTGKTFAIMHDLQCELEGEEHSHDRALPEVKHRHILTLPRGEVITITWHEGKTLKET